MFVFQLEDLIESSGIVDQRINHLGISNQQIVI